MIDESNVGNEQALAEEQVSHTQNSSNDKVNPGAIRKSTTQGILNALSTASGHDFNTVEDAIAYIARSQSQKVSGGNEQPVEQPRSSNNNNNQPSHETDLQEQFMKLKRDLESKERALMQKEIDADIMSIMGDKFDPDLMDYALQKVKSNIKFNRDGTYAIINSKGQERYGMDGTPLTINSLVDEIAQGNPKLLKQSHVSGGSGLRPGQGRFAGAPTDEIPDYSRDPAAFDAWARNMGLGKGSGLKGASVQASVSSGSRKIL